ncbi:MAG: alpha/beta fold hydrolase [Candidatus Hermodarchaeota archaeon]|nr:alpha/beta fold hydrolase [Candidatus Hermodarchaeota archaeon]
MPFTRGSSMPEIQVSDDVTLNYEEKGEGYPLLLIHGLLSDLTSWRYQVDAFARHYRTIMVDLKGFGKSTKPHKEYRVHSHADDLFTLLQHLKITQTHVCGLSMGGMVAEVLVIKYPQLVRGLILADSAAMIANYAVSDRLTLISEHDMNWFADWGTKKILRLASDEAQNHVREMIRRVDRNDYRLAIISTAGFNIANELKKIQNPVLIIQGEKDETVPMWHAEQLKSWIPEAKFVIMKGASHMTPVDNPAEFNMLVLDFLKEVDTAT